MITRFAVNAPWLGVRVKHLESFVCLREGGEIEVRSFPGNEEKQSVKCESVFSPSIYQTKIRDEITSERNNQKMYFLIVP